MNNKSNFRIQSHQNGNKIEYLINVQFKELLDWHSENHTNFQQDSKRPWDFTVRKTNIKLEIGKYDFDDKIVTYFKRKPYNYKIVNEQYIYGEVKDISDVYLVYSDGFKYLVRKATAFKDAQFTRQFTNYRGNGEEAIELKSSDFKLLNSNEFQEFLKKIQNKHQI